jgi:hypothetical protein
MWADMIVLFDASIDFELRLSMDEKKSAIQPN